MDRRTFLVATAGGLAWAATKSYAVDYADQKPARVGLIGAGWYGKCDLLRLIQVAPVDVVSLCDVDRQMLADAAQLVAARQVSKKQPRTYTDYRKMLAEKDLDIVLIATPDHWHALPMIAAVEAGADVYVQKPISVDVIEGQTMLSAARRTQRVVQVGTQRRSTPHLIDARKNIIQAGKLGKVGLVEIYCYYHMRARENPPDIAPPAHLDWDMWTGPAPLRGYNKLVHPRGWRSFMEYSNGIMGDMCIHMFDMVRWLLDLGWPQRISSTGGIWMDKNSRANIADTQTATFDYDDSQVIWQHRTWGSPPDSEDQWGAILYGDKGTLKANVWRYEFESRDGEKIRGPWVDERDKYPEDQTEKDLEVHVASAIRGHMRDLLKCIDDRGKPVADIEQGHISSASCILANVAMQLGRTLSWDPVKHEVVGDDEANRLLRRPYREPWVHPEP
jgi:predicted dehydrogenase